MGLLTPRAWIDPYTLEVTFHLSFSVVSVPDCPEIVFLRVTCAWTLTCCTSLVVSSHVCLNRNSYSSQRFICNGTGADPVCNLTELNRVEGTSFSTPLDDGGERSQENAATAVHDGPGRIDQAEQRVAS